MINFFKCVMNGKKQKLLGQLFWHLQMSQTTAMKMTVGMN